MSHLVVGNSRPWMPHFDDLHRAWKHDDLALCLGAGVSAPYGLPNWNDLVLDLLLQEAEVGKADPRRGGDWSGYYPNYRRAFGTWLMADHQFRAEVLARLFDRRTGFLERVRSRLYKAIDAPTVGPPAEPNTLTALVDLVRDTIKSGRRLAGVITLNFDDLLEQRLRAAGVDCHAVYRAGPGTGSGLPIVHLHGYLPQHGAVPDQDLVFTEDQFHGLTVSPFHWAVGELAWHLRKHTVLFVGQSMADPNVRRLLDACRDGRGSRFHYLTRPDYVVPEGEEMDYRVADLQRRARGFGEQSRRDRTMSDDDVRQAVGETLRVARELDRRLMRTLGLKVIWFRDFADLPDILRLVTRGTAGSPREA